MFWDINGKLIEKFNETQQIGKSIKTTQVAQ
jgi:hypothetical protein